MILILNDIIEGTIPTLHIVELVGEIVSAEKDIGLLFERKKFDPFFVEHTYQITSKILSHVPCLCFFSSKKMMVPFCRVEGFENKQPRASLCFTLQIPIKTSQENSIRFHQKELGFRRLKGIGDFASRSWYLSKSTKCHKERLQIIFQQHTYNWGGGVF